MLLFTSTITSPVELVCCCPVVLFVCVVELVSCCLLVL